MEGKWEGSSEVEDIEEVVLTMNDYKILATMHQEKFNAPLKSISYMGLVSETNLSINKVRQSINVFLKYNYVREGLKQVNTKRFYITLEGMDRVLKSINC